MRKQNEKKKSEEVREGTGRVRRGKEEGEERKGERINSESVERQKTRL